MKTIPEGTFFQLFSIFQFLITSVTLLFWLGINAIVWQKKIFAFYLKTCLDFCSFVWPKHSCWPSFCFSGLACLLLKKIRFCKVERITCSLSFLLTNKRVQKNYLTSIVFFSEVKEQESIGPKLPFVMYQYCHRYQSILFQGSKKQVAKVQVSSSNTWSCYFVSITFTDLCLGPI